MNVHCLLFTGVIWMQIFLMMRKLSYAIESNEEEDASAIVNE